jgi:hypothetical protein
VPRLHVTGQFRPRRQGLLADVTDSDLRRKGENRLLHLAGCDSRFDGGCTRLEHPGKNAAHEGGKKKHNWFGKHGGSTLVAFLVRGNVPIEKLLMKGPAIAGFLIIAP